MRRRDLRILSSLALLLALSGLALSAESQEEPFILWVKTLDGGSSDQARDVTVDSMDNIIVTGISVQEATENYMTVKCDGNGNQIWNRTFEGGNQAHSVAVDSADNIVVTGFSVYTASFLTIKYDKDGNLLWIKSHGEEWLGEGVATDSQNNVIVVGYYYVEDMMGHWDIQIVKCDSNGNQIWSRTYDDLDGERAFDVAVDLNDNILIAGMFYDGMTRNLAVIKYDKNGNLLWTRTYNGGYEDEGHGVAVDSLNNVIVTGFKSDSAANRYFLTIKYDRDGNRIWTKTYRKELQDEGFGVAVDSKDNIFVTGWSFDGTTRDFTTIEYDKDGNQLWTTSYEGNSAPGSLIELKGYGVAVDSTDNIIVTGAIYYIIPQKLSDFLTIKYRSRTPLITDLNNDGTVNILDVTIVATAFRTKPGDERWNETADLDKNGVINILDVAMVARDCGKPVE